MPFVQLVAISALPMMWRNLWERHCGKICHMESLRQLIPDAAPVLPQSFRPIAFTSSHLHVQSVSIAVQDIQLQVDDIWLYHAMKVVDRIAIRSNKFKRASTMLLQHQGTLLLL